MNGSRVYMFVVVWCCGFVLFRQYGIFTGSCTLSYIHCALDSIKAKSHEKASNETLPITSQHTQIEAVPNYSTIQANDAMASGEEKSAFYNAMAMVIILD